MTGQHPESDVLAEFQAGLVTGRRGASIASHLAACDRCADLNDQLGDVSALLAAAPVPALPDDLGRRLDLVLAAEVAARNSAERTVDDSAVPRASGPRHRRPWDFRLAQRVLVPAAAAVLLAAGGYGLSRVTGSSSSSSPGSTAAGPAAAAPAASALPYERSAASGASGASGSGIHPQIEAPRTFAVVTSHTDFLRATLVPQLKAELQRFGQAAVPARELPPGAVQGCALRVTQGVIPGTVTLVTLVEKARFQGQPAVVIVAVDGHHDAAWVTTASCSASSDHVLATAALPGTSAP